MGYKLAGYDVLGNVEIDPRVMEVYQRNLHPKYPFTMDIRSFLELADSRLPKELFQLDVLDGSPPCSTFSMIGKRESGWDVEKKFREGQAAQRLDDLFFWFIRVADRLRPKVVIAENVKGLVSGNARGYVNEILKAFQDAGYYTQLFLLNSAAMGVPQKRERVFFIARRKDMNCKPLVMRFSEPPILFNSVRSDRGKDVVGKDFELLKMAHDSDEYVSWVEQRIKNTHIGNFRHIISDTEIAPTLTSSGTDYRKIDKKALSDEDCRNIQTFPQDYDFYNQNPRYICGMSVPPVMMAQIASCVCEQWLSGKAVAGDGL